jgi:hypothetical protein
MRYFNSILTKFSNERGGRSTLKTPLLDDSPMEFKDLKQRYDTQTK